MKKNIAFYNLKKVFSLLLIFGWFVDFAFQRRFVNLEKGFSYNILNHSKWRKFEKDLPKCSVIDRRSVMGQFTLPICVFSLQIAPLAINFHKDFAFHFFLPKN
jgi:hypothetical protein